MRIRALVTAAAVAGATALAAPVAQAAPSGITWNGAADRAVAASIDATQNNTRKNAAGPKITSNAHSADFPGIYFIWDSKQKDNGYLKVDATLFDAYESFTLTSKESNTYWDFVIALQPDQAKTGDGYYVFFIPKVYNNKNINMVFLSEWIEKSAKSPTVNLGFIGCYVHSGTVMTTSFYWQELNAGDKVDWDAVYAAYDTWVAQGGLAPNAKGWQTSGYASLYFDGDRPDVGHADFTPAQLEGYYLAYFISPGCPTIAQVSYDRYLAYVELWNDLYDGDGFYGQGFDGVKADGAQRAILFAGGILHYRALLAQYGLSSAEPYFHFDEGLKDTYDEWADVLEEGLRTVCGQLGIDLDAYVKNHPSNF